MRTLTPALVALAALGCAHAGGAREGAALVADYAPLAVGNQWTYEVNTLGEHGTDTITILEEKDGYFADDHKQHLTIDRYGLRDLKRYLLRSPLKEGATWTNVISVSSVEHYRIARVGFPCHVPAGEFKDCVRVESRDRKDANNALVAELTFAPKVGLVQVKTYVVARGQKGAIPQVALSLKAYSLLPEVGRRAGENVGAPTP